MNTEARKKYKAKKLVVDAKIKTALEKQAINISLSTAKKIKPAKTSMRLNRQELDEIADLLTSRMSNLEQAEFDDTGGDLQDDPYWLELEALSKKFIRAWHRVMRKE